MKPIRGIDNRFSPIDQPEDSLFFGKNFILNEKYGSAMNEPGFLVSSITIPYTPMGAIPIDDRVIVFSTDEINSAIGFYNESDDTYTSVLDRTDLGFTLTKPITGEVKQNYKGEVIVVFTDKTVTAKYINLNTATNTQDLNDFLLFPVNDTPIIELISVDETGGSIKSGVVYFSIQHKLLDGTITNWSKPFGPVRITPDFVSVGYEQYDGAEAGTSTTKKIQLQLSNLDTTYDKIAVAVITKINSIIECKQFLEAEIDLSTKTITYSGNETTTDLVLLDVLENSANYKTVGCFGQVNGILYAADLSSDDLIKFQKSANNIAVNYTSKLVNPSLLIDTTTVYASTVLNSTPRGFMHGEVYALYISFILDNDSRTPGFHIPGRALTSGERASSTLASAQGITAKVFQIEDTSSFVSNDVVTGIGRGNMGAWENENEFYPNNDEFNSDEDLRGEKVRHHRFPTIDACKANHYSGNADYGRGVLDVLGIELSNIIIPSEIADRVQGYEVYYAKRTTANQTILGQSLLQFVAYNRLSSVEDTNNIRSTGGNWGIDDDDSSSIGGDDQLLLNTDYARFYAFDLLLNKPLISPSYITPQIRLNKSSDFHADSGQNWWGYKFDYVLSSASVSAIPSSSRIRRISDFVYVPQHTFNNKINNVATEECMHMKMYGGIPLSSTTLVTDVGSGYADTLGYEESYLTNLNSLKDDVYNSFTGQILISTGYKSLDTSLTTSGIIYGGDTFVNYYSYITVGPRSPIDTTYIHWNRFVRRFVCESVNNINLRHEDASVSTSRYYPKTDSGTLIESSSGDTQNLNTIAYNTDYTSVNDLQATDPNNVELEKVTKYPFRIIRGNNVNREELDTISWKRFGANNYFESVQNRGKIINIQGFGNDRLLIHHKNGLYITRSNAKLQTDIIEITLGSGDIFGVEPEEMAPSKHGYLGTQHQLSCLMCKYGYFFVDAEVGGVYLYDGKINDLTDGLKNFLRDNLKIVSIADNIDNPFTGNGITVGFDEKYERIILTVKNIDGSTDKSYTISFTPENKSWALFHDYIPDFIFNTRNGLYSYKTQGGTSNLFIHNEGSKGVYYNAIEVSPTPYSSFIDVVFKGRKDESGRTFSEILQSVSWISEVIDENGVSLFEETIDYITVRNQYQTSGKITLTKDLDVMANLHNNRNPNGTWNFNEFRDVVKDRTLKFTNTIFNDYDVILSNIDNDKSWFDKRRFEDKFHIVRLEYSNLDNKSLYLFEVHAKTRPSFR